MVDVSVDALKFAIVCWIYNNIPLQNRSVWNHLKNRSMELEWLYDIFINNISHLIKKDLLEFKGRKFEEFRSIPKDKRSKRHTNYIKEKIRWECDTLRSIVALVFINDFKIFPFVEFVAQFIDIPHLNNNN